MEQHPDRAEATICSSGSSGSDDLNSIAGLLGFDVDDFDAGWSSPVARQAHNLKAAGSNPAPATKIYIVISII